MADIDYDDYGASPRIAGGQVQRLIHFAGAVCSLALIAGVGLWGYKLAVRDVSGVPVVRALEGPMRVAPANPGGNVADHQGMAVNAIAAAGGATALPEEIILAPAPVELTAEDAPGLSLADPEEGVSNVASSLTTGPVSQTLEASVASALAIAAPELVSELALFAEPALDADATPATTEDAVAMALAEALGEALPLAPLQPDAAHDSTPGEAAGWTVRPKARPRIASGPVSGVEPVSAFSSVGPEIDPSTLTVGTRLVQLGAFDGPDVARAEWVRLRDRFGDLMTGKSLVVQSAQSGGRTFYRLRAHGFGGEDDARRFCTALLAENAACIPVAHR